MTELRWSPRSVEDLEAIHRYTARDSVHYADLVVQRLIRATERLSEFSAIGRVVPEVGQSALRELIVRPFRIVYRIKPEVVEIVTVIRSSRSFPSDLG